MGSTARSVIEAKYISLSNIGVMMTAVTTVAVVADGDGGREGWVCVWRNLEVRDDGEGRKIAATADSY